MEFRSIRQTSHISGVNRNPGAAEHDKAFVWDNNISKVKYVSIANLSANSKTTNGYVVKGDDSTGADFIWKLDSLKNPAWRREEYLKTVAKQSGGNSLIFTMNSGSSKIATLGALAWLDTVPVDIILPGNTKILFDDNDTIGGNASFTFDKTNKILQLVDFAGISVLNNTDVSAKSVLQYFGNKNIMIANGAMKTVAWGANLVNNIFIGDGTGSNALTAQNNVRIGHFAGADASTNIQGGVFVGNYAGRLETANNAFYLGNTNYGTLADFKTGSLMYGDFSTHWLRINNRLELPEEIRIGAFNIANTPLSGMVQFVPFGAPGEVKPQFYNGTLWVDFAAGLNNFLSSVSKATADVGTTDAAYRLTFVRDGLTDLTLQLGTNAFNSTIIPTALPVPTAGYIQLSSGDITDGNRGFTYSTNLSWDSASQLLTVDGGLFLSTQVLGAGTLGFVRFDGNHFYGYAKNDSGLASEWRILDAPGSGESNTASNAGISGVGVWFDKTGFDLRFKNILSVDPRIVVTDNVANKTIDLSSALTLVASNVAPVTVKTYSGSVLGSVATATGISPEVKFKKLISNTVQITENADEVILEVTGVGGGESNSALNVGTGIAVYKDKVGADLRFKTITALGNHLIASADIDGVHINIDTDDITFTTLGVGQKLVTQDPVNSFIFSQKTFIDGLATTVVTDANTIKFDIDTDIPGLAAIPTPVWVLGGSPGQGTLNFKIDYSVDTRTLGTLTPTIFHTLKIGAGLYYDYVTNTLTSTSSGGSSSDYVLNSITRTPATNALVFNSVDPVGSGIDIPISYTFGRWAFEDDIYCQDSVTGTGFADSRFRLVGDVDNPGPVRYYGTDIDGIKGFYDVAAIGGGTVVGVIAGNGMNFTTIDTYGSVDLGQPSKIDHTTINDVTAYSHTHELGEIAADFVTVAPAEYGAWYNIYATTDVRKITSSDDWSIPTKTQWEGLVALLGGTLVAGGKLKELAFWPNNNVGEATNEVGFNGRPSGVRTVDTWWGLEFLTLFACVFDSWATLPTLVEENTKVEFLDATWVNAVSIRLINSATILSEGERGTYTGNDGKIYSSIVIGGIEWLSANLNETKFRNGDWIHGFDAGVYTPISHVDWAALITEGMCYYNDNSLYGGNPYPLTTILNSLQTQINNLPLLAIGDIPYDIDFGFADFTLGTAKTYTLDLKAKKAYTIGGVVLRCDTGTFTGVAIKINGIAVTSLSAVAITGTITETTATGANTVALGDLVTLEITTGYTGTPTVFDGKLLRTLV